MVTVETLNMYRDTVKSILTPKNWEKFKEKYYDNVEMLETFIGVYHTLGRNKEKANKWFELFETSEFSKIVDKDIELHKELIERLKKLKKDVLIKMVEKEVI